MDQLTEEQIAYYREMFNDFDENKNGSLDRDEVIQLMMVCGANPTEEDVDEYMREADAGKNDGKVTFEEFCGFMTKDPDPEASLREAFITLDRDNSGYLERSEVEGILQSAGDDPELKELIDRALSDDGKIDYKEFSRLMMNQEP